MSISPEPARIPIVLRRSLAHPYYFTRHWQRVGDTAYLSCRWVHPTVSGNSPHITLAVDNDSRFYRLHHLDRLCDLARPLRVEERRGYSHTLTYSPSTRNCFHLNPEEFREAIRHFTVILHSSLRKDSPYAQFKNEHAPLPEGVIRGRPRP